MRLIYLIGLVWAAIWSWTTNESVLWCIFHAICGWLYVVYRLLGFGG